MFSVIEFYDYSILWWV